MKRLIIIIIVAFIVILSSLVIYSNIKDNEITCKTLNGINAVDAGMMIQHFKEISDVDSSPQPESVWFSREMIHDIIVLLNHEIEIEKSKLGHDAKVGVTDGFRIYFGCDTSVHPTNNGKILLRPVIVSTKDNGECRDPLCGSSWSGRKHLDYYEHSSSASLFKIKSPGQLNPIAGIISTDDCGGGAVCYKTCSTCADDNSCDKNNIHYLKRSQCETMAQTFGKKMSNPSGTVVQKGTINTTAEWFDIRLIRAFDDECKIEPNYDGIRIYFARHPDSDVTDSKRDAFVIVTTKSVKGKPGLHMDYFNCSRAPAYFDLFKSIHPLFGNGQDNGELCPYNCN